MTQVSSAYSRRAVLRGMGGLGLTALAGSTSACAAAAPAPKLTSKEFLASDRFFIAHRGAGDEAPEHTLAAYTRILDRGAQAIEISVQRTKDGVLVCHHDPTLERTANGFTGAIKDMTYAELTTHQVDMRAYVGPEWGLQPIPRLEDVLDSAGDRGILFVEPKDPAASDAVIAALAARHLEPTSVYKQYFTEKGDDAARRAGLPVWNYYDPTATAADIAALAGRSDAIGAEANNDPLDDARLGLIKAAVATGKPTIAWALHRRHQVDDLAALGVRGFMCSSWSYMAKAPAPNTHDVFTSRRVEPGDLPVRYDAVGAPVWDIDDSVALTDGSGPQSLSMGSMCPLPASYTLSFEMRFDALPPDASRHAGVVIGRTDDKPYRFGVRGPSSGQLILLRGNGSLEIRDVPPDNSSSLLLATARGQNVFPGRWETIDITVGGGTTVVNRAPIAGAPTRLSAPNVASAGYFAFTRNYGGPGVGVRFRRVRVAPATT